MPKFEELVTVSGSSWASSIYMYANQSDEELLGATTVLEELTLDFLNQKASLIGWTATRSTVKIGLEMLDRKSPPGQIWQHIVGATFLEPFGLNAPDAMLAASPNDVARIVANNPKLEHATFYTPRADRPSSYVIFGALWTPVGHTGSGYTAVGLQMSPGQIGSPFYPNGTTVTYPPLVPLLESNRTVLLGGGFVEAFAFGGAAPSDPTAQSGGDAVSVGAPPIPFTLADAVGVSSNEPAVDLAKSMLTSILNPTANYWPVTSEQFPSPEPGNIFQLADGGDVENAGLIPLLQRDVESAVWVANSDQILNSSYPWQAFCGDTATRTWPAFDPVAAGLADQLMDKFGYATDFYYYNQVFEQSELLPIACEIWESEKKGKPAFLTFTSIVLRNDWWGLKGGNKVEVFLMYLLNVADFNARLPDETKADINLGVNGSFAYWPNYKTMFENPPEVTTYTMRQVNLLAALGEYSVLDSSELLKRFLGG